MTAAAMPSYDQLRRRAAGLLWDRGEWAGCPIPIEDARLVIEPTYPYQFPNPPQDSGLEPGERCVNWWHSRRRQCEVYIVHAGPSERPTVTHYTLPTRRSSRRVEQMIDSMRASWAHDSDAECTGMLALFAHLNEGQQRYYMLLGYFLETSKRSGVTYLFRKNRPTLAMRMGERGLMPLAALCLHPIAYYDGTCVGAMTPSDDVLAHLLLMRGDEPMFWRRANQHPFESFGADL